MKKSWKNARASKWHKSAESHVETIGYDARQSTLLARFKDYAKVYRYHPVDIEKYKSLKDDLQSKDFGKRFRKEIIEKYTQDGIDYVGEEE